MAKPKKTTKPTFNIVEMHIARDMNTRQFSSDVEAHLYFKDTYLDKDPDELIATITPLEQAKDIVYEACGFTSFKKIQQHTDEALKLDPNCSSAYLLLAHECDNMGKKKTYYLQAAEAAKNTLGSDFDKIKGEQITTIDAYPYMTAKIGYADVLWETKEQSKAIEILKELVELNPADPMNIHRLLLTRLLILKRFLEADRIVDQFNDDKSTHMLYSKAYISFNKQSKVFSAAHSLKEAMLNSPYVPMFLFGFADEPEDEEFTEPGNPAEAADYLNDADELWVADKKAMHWIVAEFARNKADIVKIIEERDELEEWDNPDIPELNMLAETMNMKNFGEIEEFLNKMSPDEFEKMVSEIDDEDLDDEDLDDEDDPDDAELDDDDLYEVELDDDEPEDVDLDKEDEPVTKKPAGKSNKKKK